MDGQSAVIIVDKAMLPEPVHEMADPRPGRADHLRQGVLIHSGDYSFSLAFLAKMREQQENPSQRFSLELKSWSTRSCFISDVAREQMLDKQFRDIMMLVKHARHQRLSILSRVQSVIAIAVAIRTVWPARHPSPKNSRRPEWRRSLLYPVGI